MREAPAQTHAHAHACAYADAHRAHFSATALSLTGFSVGANSFARASPGGRACHEAQGGRVGGRCANEFAPTKNIDSRFQSCKQDENQIPGYTNHCESGFRRQAISMNAHTARLNQRSQKTTADGHFQKLGDDACFS